MHVDSVEITTQYIAWINLAIYNSWLIGFDGDDEKDWSPFRRREQLDLLVYHKLILIRKI